MITGTLHDLTGKWDVGFQDNAIFKLHNVGGGGCRPLCLSFVGHNVSSCF